MTGYTVHTGSTVQFSQSWDRIFAAGGSRGKAKQAAAAADKKAPAKKAAVKKAKRKRRA
jgi:hypothetical protein